MAQHPPGGTGGDVIFSVGHGSPDHHHGSFSFRVPNPEPGPDLEILRIDPDGSFTFKGEKQAEDRLLYEAFRHWVIQCQANLGKGCTVHIAAQPEKKPVAVSRSIST